METLEAIHKYINKDNEPMLEHVIVIDYVPITDVISFINRNGIVKNEKSNTVVVLDDRLEDLIADDIYCWVMAHEEDKDLFRGLAQELKGVQPSVKEKPVEFIQEEKPIPDEKESEKVETTSLYEERITRRVK